MNFFSAFDRKQNTPPREKTRKKLLVILDLDETLVHFDSTQNNVHFRPHIDQLFDFFEKHKSQMDVGIWTFGTRGYARSIVATMRRTFTNTPDFKAIWSRENQTKREPPKSLNKICKHINSTRNTDYDQCVLVDDLPENVGHLENSSGKNKGILVKKFHRSYSDDSELKLVIEHLEQKLNRIHPHSSVEALKFRESEKRLKKKSSRRNLKRTKKRAS